MERYAQIFILVAFLNIFLYVSDYSLSWKCLSSDLDSPLSKLKYRFSGRFFSMSSTLKSTSRATSRFLGLLKTHRLLNQTGIHIKRWFLRNFAITFDRLELPIFLRLIKDFKVQIRITSKKVNLKNIKNFNDCLFCYLLILTQFLVWLEPISDRQMWKFACKAERLAKSGKFKSTKACVGHINDRCSRFCWIFR